MLDRVRKAINEYGLLTGVTSVVAAVSGGADSVCMLDMLSRLREEYGYKLVCAHFNHCLRGEESDADESYVKTLCAGMGIECFCGRGDVAALARADGTGIEEAARKARYAFLESVAAGLDNAVIATAHTANDSAETVLFNIIRGTGLRGAGGIRPKRGGIIRPLLLLSCADTEGWCVSHALHYVTDSTNADLSYARNRIRRSVLPELMRINPGAAENILRFARTADDADEYIKTRAKKLYASAAKDGMLDTRKIKTQPRALRTQTLRLFLSDSLGDSGDSRLISELDAAMTGQTDPPRVQAGEDSFIECDHGFFYPADILSDRAPLPLTRGGSVCFGDREITAGEGEYSRRFSLKASVFDAPCLIRAAKQGDIYEIPNVGKKAVRRMYIDRKLPRIERARLPLMERGGEIVWICGVGASGSWRAEAGEEYINLTVKEKDR